jgi:hypothetical protein
MPNMNDGQPQQQEMDPTTVYSDLVPAQRSEVAKAFIDRFRRCDDPGAREYARVDPHYVSPSELALMHQYAADIHPDILAEVMKNPVMTEAFGGFAASTTEQMPPDEGRASP